MLELKHLRTIQGLARFGSIAACAENLHITQSAISHQLKELEVRIGAQLFYRKTKPIKFTSQGQVVITLANSVLPQIAAAEKQLNQQELSSRFTLAIDCHSCFQWLLPTIKQFQKSFTALDVDLESGFHQHPLERLLAGEIDVMITSDVESRGDLHFLPLFGYELQLVMSNDHPLVALPSISPSDLTSQVLITYPVDKRRMDVYNLFLKPNNCEPLKWKKVDNTSTLLQMVSGGFGVAALPEWAVRTFENQELIATRPLGEGIRRHLYACVRLADKECEHIQAFVDMTRQMNSNHSVID
ncbi:putative LysR family transcriptional regulator [Vibrio halioticoli NBRC 102217]|uniref:HTH-type transcriptional regulator MetR n=1 Tax=Vibrio halioticoli NBRC 102217 TaxID=1219072 RepID=V5HKE4_9VIBR|nr:LysR substrate-binding domain-containing protein [Vibrio halioticoli]GAD89715.1 putative LysR family transcriptional regulator [Vibrio halioticoli NBRC 102217]